MSVLYADYNCPNCGIKDKLMYELEDDNNQVVLAGQALNEESSFVNKCGFCQEYTDVIAAVREKTFLGFLNSLESKQTAQMNIPNTEDILKDWGKEKLFVPIIEVEFNTQPFAVGKVIDVGVHQLTVKNVYRMEWVEKDFEVRIENPIPDAYWYEVVDQYNKVRWMKVESTEGENVFFNEGGIIVSSDKEKIEEMPIPEAVEQIFQMDWFGGRTIEAYQYINGVRLIVVDYKGIIEMDLFNDTLEEAMETLENNTELGVFNE